MPDLNDEEFMRLARPAMTDPTPLPVSISIADAWSLVSALQFTVRISQTGPQFKARLKDIAHQFQGAIEDAHPQVTRVLNMGWDSAYDVPATPKAAQEGEVGEPPTGDAPLKEVINAFAIHWNDKPGEAHWCELRRPQDWGHPRWMYRKYVLEAMGCRHEAHCYADKALSDLDHLQLFSSLLTTIAQTYPPTRREVCDRSHLQEDDFWEESWGPRPPYVETDEEDDLDDY